MAFYQPCKVHYRACGASMVLIRTFMVPVCLCLSYGLCLFLSLTDDTAWLIVFYESYNLPLAACSLLSPILPITHPSHHPPFPLPNHHPLPPTPNILHSYLLYPHSPLTYPTHLYTCHSLYYSCDESCSKLSTVSKLAEKHTKH